MASLVLSDIEKEADKKFREEHAQCRRLAKKYQAQPTCGSFIYELNRSSGIGISISIRCPYCGRKKDITDVTNW